MALTSGAGASFPVNAWAWPYQMQLSFPGYTAAETLTNFPALIVFSNNVNSSGFNYNQFSSPNGYDLRFTTADGLTELNYEVEQWNTNGNSCVWVQVPQLSNGCSIVAYWGNPSAASAPEASSTSGAAWPTNAFAAVWHMDQSNAMDSTANGNDGTATGSVSGASGIIAGAQQVSGGGHVRVPSTGDLEFTNPAATYSAWVYFNTLPGNSEQVIMRKEYKRELGFGTESQPCVRNLLHTDGANDGWTTNNDDLISPAPVLGQWYYTAFTYDGGVLRSFWNGVPLNAGHTVTGNIIGDDNANTGIGAYDLDGTLAMNAIIDEVRIEPVVRSASWIMASYMTIASNSSFNTYGNVQLGVITNFATNVVSQAIDLEYGINSPYYLASSGSGNITMYFGTNTLDQVAGNWSAVSVTLGWDNSVPGVNTYNLSGGSLTTTAGSMAMNSSGGGCPAIFAISGTGVFTTPNHFYLGSWGGDAGDATLNISGNGVFNQTGSQIQLGASNSYINVTGGNCSISSPYFRTDGHAIGGITFTLDNSPRHISPIISTGSISSFDLSGSSGRIHIATSGFAPALYQTFDLIKIHIGAGKIFVPGGDPNAVLAPGDSANWSLNIINDGSNVVLQATALTSEVGSSDWPYRMQVAFPGYTQGEVLTNFPALVVFSNNVGNSGFNYSQFASANGYDLRFSTADGSTELNYEIEQWNTNGNSCVWVQVPQLYSGCSIWAYWGNSGMASAPAIYTTNGAVWSGNAYAAVWHMVGSNTLDSTANGNDGSADTRTGSISSVTGIIGVAQQVSGGGHVTVPYSSTLSFVTNQATYSGWVYFNTLPTNGEQVLMRKEQCRELGFGNESQPYVRNMLKTYGIGTTNGWGSQFDEAISPAPVVGQWYYVAFTYDGGILRNFWNGTPLSAGHTVTGNIEGDPYSTGIGAYNGNLDAGPISLGLNGAIDEVRAEQVFRSPNWILANYLTVASNASFNAYGSVLSSVVTNFSTNVVSQTIDLEYGVNSPFNLTYSGSGIITIYYGTNTLNQLAGDWSAWSVTMGQDNHVPGTDTYNLSGGSLTVLNQMQLLNDAACPVVFAISGSGAFDTAANFALGRWNDITNGGAVMLNIGGNAVFNQTGGEFQFGMSNSYVNVTGGDCSISAVYYRTGGHAIGGLTFTLDNSATHISPLVATNGNFDLSGSPGAIHIATDGFTPTNGEIFTLIQLPNADTISAPAAGTNALLDSASALNWSLSISTDGTNNMLQATAENFGGGVPTNGIPPLAWFNYYYIGASNYAAIATNDTDGDGMTAWDEYVAGTDPTNDASYLGLGIGISNGNVILTYQSLAAAGPGYVLNTRYYDLESASNLLDGIWQPVSGATNVIGDNTTVIYTNTSTNALMYYRVKARLQ